MARLKLFSALIVVITTFFVLLGWKFNHLDWVQWMQSYAPMQFNSAICFLFIALSGLSFERKQFLLSRFLSLFALFIGGVSFAQYYVYVPFELDQLFHVHQFNYLTSSSGRMAPNAALGISLLAFTLFFNTFDRMKRWTRLPLSLALAIALAAISGFVFDLERAYAWKNSSGMAPQTAFSILLLTAINWKVRLKDSAWQAGIMFFTIASLLAVAVSQREIDVIRFRANSLVQQDKNYFVNAFNDRSLALKSILARSLSRPHDIELWNKDSAQMLEDYSDLWQMYVVDRLGKVIFKAKEGSDPLPKDIVIQRVIQTQKSRLYINLNEDPNFFWIVTPSNVSLGAIVSRHDVHEFLKLICNKMWSQHEIRIGNHVVFSSLSPNQDSIKKQWGFHYKIRSTGITWDVTAVPNPKEIDPKMNVLLWAILLFGIVFSVSIYFSLRYYFLSIDRLEKEKTVSSSLESILLFVPVGVFKADLKGNYLWVNQSWMDKTGISEKEAAGQGWQKSIHPEDRLAVYQEWENSIREEREFDLTYRIINTAYQMIKSSKEITWVHTKSTYLRDDQGNLTGILGSMMDISKERTVQETMRLQQLKLVQADKMTTLGEMAASIAHEVNNPLSIIQASIENLHALKNADKLDDEKFFDLTKKISQTVERAGKIIRGLKTFARDGSNDPKQTIKVQTIIHDSLDFCTTRFKKNGVELRVSAIPSEWLVIGRAVQIEQVLLNLLTNAFDSIRSLPDPWISVSAKDAGDCYEISVEDSGPGITDDLSKKIMEPFFTTKPVGHGTGLGLSISRNIINEHGGELRLVRREPNPKFTFDLPKAKG